MAAIIIANIVANFAGIIPAINIVYTKYEHTHIAIVAIAGFSINFLKVKFSSIVFLKMI